jgi:heterodisulfide reductase subunit B
MITQAVASYSYFPGCSMTATNRAYDLSTRNVARVLRIELLELDDWNCCGATAYMAIREKRSLVLSARNLAIAEKRGRDLATICNACYVVLRKANEYLAKNSLLREEVDEALQAGQMHYDGTVRVRHFLDIIVNDLGEDVIRRHVQRDLSDLRVACYSGCQLSRPFQDVDDPEYPELMGRLCRWLGAEVLPFPLAAKCCGGMSMTTRPEIGQVLSGKILRVAKLRGADCIVTACPLCQINLEAYQSKLSEVMGADCHLPVLYFTQLLGAAFGLGAKELALKDSLTPVEQLLAVKVTQQ